MSPQLIKTIKILSNSHIKDLNRIYCHKIRGQVVPINNCSRPEAIFSSLNHAPKSPFYHTTVRPRWHSSIENALGSWHVQSRAGCTRQPGKKTSSATRQPRSQDFFLYLNLEKGNSPGNEVAYARHLFISFIKHSKVPFKNFPIKLNVIKVVW